MHTYVHVTTVSVQHALDQIHKW